MRNLLKTSVLLCDELLVYETDFFALITLTKLIFAMISFQYTPSRVSARFFIVICKNITFFTALQSIKMYFYHPHIFLTNISTEDNTASLIFEINTLPLLFQQIKTFYLWACGSSKNVSRNSSQHNLIQRVVPCGLRNKCPGRASRIMQAPENFSESRYVDIEGTQIFAVAAVETKLLRCR